MNEMRKIGFETVGANTILHDLTPKQKMYRDMKNRKDCADFKKRVNRKTRKKK